MSGNNYLKISVMFILLLVFTLCVSATLRFDSNPVYNAMFNMPENLSINGSFNYAQNQLNKQNNYTNVPIRQSDWDTESKFYDFETAPLYSTGTLTQWDVTVNQDMGALSKYSCRVGATAGNDCIMAMYGRNPSTSGFYYNSAFTNANFLTRMFAKYKFYLNNATLVVGAFTSAQISADLSAINSTGYGMAFYLDYVDANYVGLHNWTILCDNTRFETNIPYVHNNWTFFDIKSNGVYGYDTLQTSWEFLINGNSVYNCTDTGNSKFITFVGTWVENRFTGGVLGQDVVVGDYHYYEQNRFNYEDIGNFNGGASSS